MRANYMNVAVASELQTVSQPGWYHRAALSFLLGMKAILLISFSLHAAPINRVIYVNAAGNDSNDGQSPASAIRSLAHARNSMRGRDRPKIALLSGRFTLTEPFNLGAEDEGTEWRSAPGSQAILVSLNADVGIQVTGGDHVTLSGLRLENFRTDAIRVYDASFVSIIGNSVSETHSTSWSQGAIHLQGKVPDAKIANNHITGADYAGIIVDTKYDSRVDRIKIWHNIVHDSCRRVADCGAIYINDRGRKSRDITILDNRVEAFGSVNTHSRGIYLDDWVSHVTVSGNFVAGPGEYAFQIHGGSNNIIRENRIDLNLVNYALLYQPVGELGPHDLEFNQMTGNTFVTSSRRPTLMRPITIAKDRWPKICGNRFVLHTEPHPLRR